MSEVMLNGTFIGYVDNYAEFVNQIRSERRRGLMNNGVNVSYNKDLDQVYVESDRGRVRRPLIVVKDGLPLLTDQHIRQLEKNEISWKDLVDQGLAQYIITTEPSRFFGITDSQGNYSIMTDHGNYLVKQIPLLRHQQFIGQLCPTSPGYYSVDFDAIGSDTSGFDFSNQVIDCPFLIVDIAGNNRRRCFKNYIYIYYRIH